MNIATIDRSQILSQSILTALTIIGMLILPFVVHLIPFSGKYPLGVYLLPMFLGPLVAAFYVSPVSLILASIIAPIMNNLLTGLPQVPGLYFLMGELLLFSLFVHWAIQNRKTFVGFSAIAYLAASLIILIPSLIILNDGIALPMIGDRLARLAFSLPGILILVVIERILIRKKTGK